MAELTHLDSQGRARMVDVTAKEATVREAVARGVVKMKPETLRAIQSGKVPKGNVYEAARLAGIMAAKRTGDLVPLCHPLNLTHVDVVLEPSEEAQGVLIESRARTKAETGVEMEALVAVSVAALTLYDMCKALDKEIVISDVRLVCKTGGKSGTFRRPGEQV